MWASALSLVAFIPLEVCPIVMLAGLVVLGRSLHSGKVPLKSPTTPRSFAQKK
jgi:hypothetical protein